MQMQQIAQGGEIPMYNGQPTFNYNPALVPSVISSMGGGPAGVPEIAAMTQNPAQSQAQLMAQAQAQVPILGKQQQQQQHHILNNSGQRQSVITNTVGILRKSV